MYNPLCVVTLTLDLSRSYFCSVRSQAFMFVTFLGHLVQKNPVRLMTLTFDLDLRPPPGLMAEQPEQEMKCQADAPEPVRDHPPTNAGSAISFRSRKKLITKKTRTGPGSRRSLHTCGRPQIRTAARLVCGSNLWTEK